MPTFTQIGTAQVAGVGGVTSIDFTSIPATFTDLCLKMSLRSQDPSGTDYLAIAINGTTSTFQFRTIEANGSSVGTFTSATDNPRFVGQVGIDGYAAGSFGSTEIYFPNYTNSLTKSYSVDSVTEDSVSTVFMNWISGNWSNTSVINRITITSATSTGFVQFSSAYLYGVSNA
jgi:hypothetical protein